VRIFRSRLAAAVRRSFVACTMAVALLAGAGNAVTGVTALAGVGPQQVPPAAPSSAGLSPLSAGNRIVQGSGSPADDLGDEATLCDGCSFWNGNYAGFWQAILWADGFLASGEVDCEFGPNTATATRNWQSWLGLGVDGVVGPETRGTADNYLFTSTNANYNLYYQGTGGRVVYLHRDTTSPYNYWIWWGGQWRVVYYNTTSILGC
jgi:Putative peptidoglycan binding domain